MSVESFKAFVRTKPNLINYVDRGEKSWQDFYNLYELYGEKSSVWDKYLSSNGTSKPLTIKDVFGMIQNIDVSSVQDSISSLQKGISYIEDLVKSKETSVPKISSYEARPLYKYFDD